MGNVDRTFPMLCFRRVDTTYRMFTVSTLDSIKRRRGKVVSSQSRSAFVRSKSYEYADTRFVGGLCAGSSRNAFEVRLTNIL